MVDTGPRTPRINGKNTVLLLTQADTCKPCSSMAVFDSALHEHLSDVQLFGHQEHNDKKRR